LGGIDFASKARQKPKKQQIMTPPCLPTTSTYNTQTPYAKPREGFKARLRLEVSVPEDDAECKSGAGSVQQKMPRSVQMGVDRVVCEIDIYRGDWVMCRVGSVEW
jgi:hypothetical protein